MDIGIIRMSSKGQIVIPASMRNDLTEGEQLLVIREGDRFILKPLDTLEASVKEDILFAEKTERAFLEFGMGNFSRKRGADFIDDLKSW
ncbi:MAG: SpoVT / AbrB like domain protein [Methanoregulaceae archaeon PtaU1.Bin066]|jgi:AbrB family looped-hinge helix DNA binding protein|nr:MAG: SpoVT / AbrB like domain protein [Methanoregulaceae archaeon PtaU1.Bin066]